MARNVKQGLSYFPLDVDFFEDIKIRKLQRACGNQSISVFVYILCSIYRSEGYYFGIGSDETFLIAEKFGISEGAITEIVKKAVSVGLFDCHMYEEHNILTSRAIQERFFRACKDCKKTVVRVTADFLLIDINSGINVIYSGRNKDNSGKNDINKSKVYNSLDVPARVEEKIYTFAEMRHLNPQQVVCLTERLKEITKDEQEQCRVLDCAIVSGWKNVYPIRQDKGERPAGQQKNNPKNRFNNFEQRDYSAEELEKMFDSKREAVINEN